MTRLLRSPIDWMFAYETPPSENPPASPEATPQQSEGSAAQSGFLSRDEWDQYRTSLDERVNGITKEVTEGFGWLRQQMTQQTPPADDAVPDSTSEPIALEVQDRPVVRNKKPRTRLNLGALFR